MSDYDSYFLRSTTSINPLYISPIDEDQIYLVKNKRNSVNNNINPVEFTATNVNKISKVILQENFKYPYRFHEFDTGDSNINFHLKSFLLSLDAYVEGGGTISDQFLLKKILDGPDWTTTLKRIRSKSFTNFIGASYLEEPDWINETPIFPIKRDIGEIFNYSYNFFWKEKDEEDYKLGREATCVSRKKLNRFKQTLRELLPDFLYKTYTKEEISLEYWSSSSVDDNLMKLPLIDQDKELTISDYRSEGKRCVIPIAPGNCRDSVILKPRDLLRIKLIDLQVNYILQNYKPFNKGVASNNLGKFEYQYKKFSNLNGYFLCRDFEKEGITKPRELLTAMLEVLQEKYPDAPAFDAPEFYKYYTLETSPNVLEDMKRGHGLGMANSLTSLMQVVLMEMLKDSLTWGNKIRYLILNDDIVINVPSYNKILTLWDYEDVLFDKLSIKKNPKKSFYSEKGFVFCERYHKHNYDNLNEKKSYKIREILQCLNATNIVSAKQIISSLTSHDFINDYIKEIISFWGYEFYPKEYLYPTEFGGWFNTKFDGVSLSYVEMKKLGYNDKVCRAYFACKFDHVKGPRVKNSTRLSKIERMHPELKGLFDEFSKRIFNIGDKQLLYEKFYSPKHDKFVKRAWDRLLNQRQRAFENAPVLEFESFIDNLSFDSYYPIDEVIEKWVFCDKIIGESIDLYSPTNPLNSYLRGIGLNNGFEKNKYGIYFCEDSIDGKYTADLRKRLAAYLSKLGYVRNNIVPMYLIPENDNDFIEFWNSQTNPQTFSRACALVNEFFLPILKDKYRNHEVIEARNEVFGYTINKSTYQHIQEYVKLVPRNFIFAALKNRLSNEEIDIFYDLFLEEVERLRILELQDSDLSESSFGDDELSEGTLERIAHAKSVASLELKKPEIIIEKETIESLGRFLLIDAGNNPVKNWLLSTKALMMSEHAGGSYTVMFSMAREIPEFNGIDLEAFLDFHVRQKQEQTALPSEEDEYVTFDFDDF